MMKNKITILLLIFTIILGGCSFEKYSYNIEDSEYNDLRFYGFAQNSYETVLNNDDYVLNIENEQRNDETITYENQTYTLTYHFDNDEFSVQISPEDELYLEYNQLQVIPTSVSEGIEFDYRDEKYNESVRLLEIVAKNISEYEIDGSKYNFSLVSDNEAINGYLDIDNSTIHIEDTLNFQDAVIYDFSF